MFSRMGTGKTDVPVSNNYEATSRIGETRTTFKWNIENFSQFPSDHFTSIESRLFKCSHCDWLLQLYPNGVESKAKGYVSIYLRKLPSITSKTVEYKISLKGKHNIEQNAHEARRCFTAEAGFDGWSYFIKREILFGDQREKLMFDDILIVYCEIAVKGDIVWVSRNHLIEMSVNKKDENEDFRVPKATEILVGDIKAQLKNQNNCDVTLQVGEKAFPAHKFILGARSRVFAAMFEHDFEEKHTNVVTIKDIEEEVMDDLLLYIYSANVKDLSVEKAAGLYVAADKYDLCELKSQCRDFLLSHLSADNACDLAVLADTHNDGLIIDSVKTFVRKNTFLLTTEQWRNFSKKNLRLAYEITVAIPFIEP